MIKSCKDCKTKCCKSGPGPYKKVSAHEWLQEVQGSKKYNSMCENFDGATEQCKIWHSPELPVVCRTYVCGIREYSEEELRNIDIMIKRYNKYKLAPK